MEGKDIKDIGVTDAVLKKRTIRECLNCKKPECNGCPKTEMGK